MKFLTPAAFWFAAAIPVVILFYLLKRKRVVRLVSSTLLWQKFLAETQASAPFQRLRYNWLLILQLLMLALAIFALARPYFSGRLAGGNLQVLILDASASMQCTDETPSRFEKARAEALKLVNSLRDTDRMVVLLAAAVTEVKQSETSEKSLLRRAIESCRVTDSPTRLVEALKMAESLTRDKTGAEVHLFSDGAAPGLSEIENKGLRLVYHVVGQRANNLGIVSLDVRPNPEDASRRAIFTSVANSSPDEQKTEIELRFDDQLLETKSITIPATNTAPVVFLATQPHDGVFSVRISARDDLAADNQASIVSVLPQPVKVLLVTHGNRLLEKALKAAGKVELSVASDVTESKPIIDLVVLESNWPFRISFPIFIANAVDWLNPASVQASQLLVKAGEPFRQALNEPTQSAEVTFPDGSRRSLVLDPNAQELVFGDTAKQGVYHLSLGTNQMAFCVDLLDSAESDTHPKAELNFGKFGTVAATTMRRANVEVWRWIAAIGLAVLMFEWWYYHRRTA